MQLTPAITAHGHQRPVGRFRNRLRPPDFPQNDIDQGGARMHQAFDRLFRQKTSLQLLVSVAQQSR